MKKNAQSDTAALRQRAEVLLRKKMKKSVSPLTESEIKKLILELQLHQIELELKNEELILAKERAEAVAEKYAELYDFALPGYFTLSRETEILDMNHAGAKMLGKVKSQLKNRKFLSFVSKDSRPVFHLFLGDVFDSAAKERCELTLLIGDNSPIYVFIEAIASEEGDQCFLTATDITERKLAEELILERSEKLNRVFNNMSDGVVNIDSKGNFNECNQAALSILGLTEDQFLGRTATDPRWKSFREEGTDFPFEYQPGIIALRTGQRNKNIIGLDFPTGDRRWINVNAIPYDTINKSSAAGSVERNVLVTFTDITENKKAEDELLKVNRRITSILEGVNIGT